jgi:DNA polymerase I-like protein with 3'-5' exonuclease and polymerase domains
LIHADVKSLELVTAGFLSRDPVLIEEINNGADIHEANKQRFGLPHRRIAKIFVFRLIYGGQAYSYAHDSDFNHISKSQDYWQEVVDQFYDKYKTIQKWHDSIVKQVVNEGRLVMPTGRQYVWDRSDVAKRLWFHRPKILNYPVQGLGADLVAIGRVALWKRLRAANIPALFISTVHDSIDIDVESCYNSRVCELVKEAFEDVPKNFYNLFGSKFDLPIKVEIGYGPNLAQLEEYKG